MPILNWSVRRQGFAGPMSAQWADLRHLRNPPSELRRRIEASLELYPCDLLFVHRDAENRPIDQRAAEIVTAAEGLQFPIVRVIPVRMMEAWLLTDEGAIRSAAGNPNGTDPLNVPLTPNTRESSLLKGNTAFLNQRGSELGVKVRDDADI